MRHQSVTRPLTARSAVLSTLLGAHPPRLPARSLVRVGELFGIAEGTIRVALSRMVAAGDLTQVDGDYQLTSRLRDRQARQDQSRSPSTIPWNGDWEIAVVTAARRSPAERTAFRTAMTGLRLAELREGTWLRPANLVRERPGAVVEQCTFLSGRPETDVTGTLWDLPGWAARARELESALDEATDLASTFILAAAVLRHFLADPLLPPELLPRDWPGTRLRTRYEEFDERFVATLRKHIGVD
ncbi:PaaX family transcriptional regulator C-terminal domain-containing protein [Actinophytocola glycyrrhizae]|uniref:PaaX family transcriptional regulator C-terminal domain-containing protein n=1 Tax=Actinophytocola glycyrrhizae TaxID=2044873 RepID=A0ABV9SEN0_9PSEU